MKSILLTFIFLGASFMNAQNINKEITTGKSPYLLGKINKEGLTSANYNGWFTKNYDNYQPDETVLRNIANTLKDYEILLFMGTWCGDSKREVPRFYKILELSDYPMEQLTAVALSSQADMYKQSPEHEEKGLNIHRVPTFILYKNGKEVNRIVEEPVESLEKDIQKIVSANSYSSNYHTVTKIHTVLQSSGLQGLKKASKDIINENELESMYELNTYAHILFTSNKTSESIAVLKLNQTLFPDNYRTYQNLGNKYARLGKRKKALKYYKQAQNIEPNDQRLNKSISELE